MADLKSQIEELAGPAVKVDEEEIRACQEKDEFGRLSLNLFKEATMLVWATCNAYYESGKGFSSTRNQAVCMGLLSRISKLMMSVLKLSSDVEHGQSVQILSRCMIESSVDLKYLLAKNDNTTYERFVKFGLKSERDLYDIIQENIKNQNGKELEIERDMLLSIATTCENSGVKIEDIDSRAGNWGGSYRDKMKAIGIEDSYPIFQGMASQAIHGSWSDLIRNYLDKNDAGYKPKSEHKHTDGKLLGPLAGFATNAARAYIDTFFNARDADHLIRRIEDCQQKMSLVERSRPGWEQVP